MSEDKDKNVIHNLFYEFHYADDLGVIKSKLVEYVATVRKAEKVAAFKAAADYIRGQRFAMDRNMAKRLAEHFEAAAAAADSREGGDDG